MASFLPSESQRRHQGTQSLFFFSLYFPILSVFLLFLCIFTMTFKLRKKSVGKRPRTSGIEFRDEEDPEDSIMESSPSGSGNGSDQSEGSGDDSGNGASSDDGKGDEPWTDLGIEFHDPTHKARFRIHVLQTVMPTRYYDPKTTLILGFREPLIELIDRIGFTDFVKKGPQKTSRRLTLEFISTVDWVGRPLGGESRVTFRLMNQDFNISLRELNMFMGWNPNSPTDFERSNATIPQNPEALGTLYSRNYNPNQVWTILAKERYNNRVKSSAIQHPAFRYLHRMLVYACYGRTQLGQPSQKDVMALWLGTEPRNPSYPPLVNYGEMWVHHWINYRNSKVTRTKLVMGGGVTQLVKGLLGSQALMGIAFVSEENLLNIQTLMDGHFIVSSNTPGRWGWLVADKLWCELPNARVGKKFMELRSKDRYALPQDECIPSTVVQPRPTRLPPGSSRAAGSSSSHPHPPQATLDSLQAQLQVLQIGQNQQTDLLYNMFSQGVASGIYQPYLNFPHYPMQQGPLPGWHNGQPTHPYYPPRPEGYDYRFPGGSNPAYDPNIPPLDPTQPIPDEYYTSVPPMEETWDSAPIPPWGGYAD